jgi:hypothetical protein
MIAVTTVMSLVCVRPVTGDGRLLSRDVEVPPVDEISVIDPGTNRELKPEAVVRDGRVEIAPTIIVHKYYYSGDRDFRGPAFPGGPSIVAVQHPDTGEQLYLDVMMLPGSPRVVYRRHLIEYHFGKQAIRIQFCNLTDPLHPKHPVVKYLNTCDDIRNPNGPHAAGHGVHSWLDRAGIKQVCKSAANGTKSILNSSADGIKAVGTAVVSPVKKVVSATPLGSVLKPDLQQEAQRLRDSEVQRAQAESERLAGSIPTLR